MEKKSKQKKGFSLIEMLVFLFIFIVASLAFYKSFSVATAYIVESKNRLAAAQVANEKMEIIRSLPYVNIGTKRSDGAGGWLMGIPGGDILEYETVTKNTRTFYVHTQVKYTDDSFDGTAAAGTDLRPADYKEARVQVSWDPGYAEKKSAILVSRFVPPGVEAISTGGILSVNVQDNLGAPIDGVAVRLKNTNTGIDQTYNTVAGNAMFFEVPEDINPNYEISVSKSGLFSVQTYPAFDAATPGSFDPIDKNMAITAGSMWTSVITTDQKSDLKIETRDMLGANVPNVEFSLEGGRKMGDVDPTATPLVPLFSYKQDTLDSGSGAEIDITDSSGLSSGTYKFTPTSVPAGYEFFKMASSTISDNNFYLDPGVNLGEAALFLNESTDSLLVTVVKDADNQPLEGVTVKIKDAGLTYDLEAMTDYAGRAFFLNGANALNPGSHEITATFSGYTDKIESINVSGLTKKELKLEAL